MRNHSYVHVYALCQYAQHDVILTYSICRTISQLHRCILYTCIYVETQCFLIIVQNICKIRYNLKMKYAVYVQNRCMYMYKKNVLLKQRTSSSQMTLYLSWHSMRPPSTITPPFLIFYETLRCNLPLQQHNETFLYNRTKTPPPAGIL